MISILMPAYNAEQTVHEAIDSILFQTYQDWELLICDDGSIDNTYDILLSYSKNERRIKVVKNSTNLGLQKTLNKLLALAQGDYIARMDADDISHPDRLQKELEVLIEESDIDIVSTAMIYFDEFGEWGRNNPIEYPSKYDFVKGTPICHAPCLVRKQAFIKVDAYSESKYFKRCEDYHLWAKMFKAGYKAKNLLFPYYKMRDDRNAYSRRTFGMYLNEARARVFIYILLDLPVYTYIFALRPVLVSLLPKNIYNILHRKKLNPK